MIDSSSIIRRADARYSSLAKTKFQKCRVELHSFWPYHSQNVTRVGSRKTTDCFSSYSLRILFITGHSFRRTSATILANSGADMEMIMRHGNWRNESCAKGYIEDSLGYKTRMGQMIQSSILGPAETPPSNTAQVSLSSNDTVPVGVEFLFESGIDDADLVDIVDRASQSIVFHQISDNRNDTTYQHANDDDVANRNGVINRHSRVVVVEDHTADDDGASLSEVSATSSAVLTQSITKNSSLNVILSHSLMSVHFEKMENCSFNFYLGSK